MAARAGLAFVGKRVSDGHAAAEPIFERVLADKDDVLRFVGALRQRLDKAANKQGARARPDRPMRVASRMKAAVHSANGNAAN